MNGQKKILLFHLHSNGDCLYATAVARQIKQDYPGCHLTWGIAAFCKSIIDNNPFVDAVWEIPGVNKINSSSIHRKLKKEILAKKRNGEYDEVFFTQLIDDNLANYDGCIRSGIFRGYNRPVTVPVTPVLRLREQEVENARLFAEKHQLAKYKNVILFEFAPQSAQLAITPEGAIEMAGDITKNESTAIILSSGIKIGDGNNKVIDGSVLTLRETAALTHYCTLLLGCSSGISWIATSEPAKPLPMIQILDPYSPWVNPMSRDFERFGFSTENLIEIYDDVHDKVIQCMNEVLTTGFEPAKKHFFTPLPLHFKGTSRGIYNMLCFLQFGAIARHIRINVSVFGWHPLLLKEIFMGFASAPFKLASNLVRKHILGQKIS